jgi:hypothetical protein
MLPDQASAVASGYGSGGCDRARRGFQAAPEDLSPPYIAFLGGSETLGRDVAKPFPALLGVATGLPVANLAAPHAGPDYYLGHPALLKAAARAEIAVLQLPGADALSNPFYTVHSRRNDRFLAATPCLHALFPKVDLTDIHFTRHLHQALARADAVAHARVVHGLRQTWVLRMRALLRHLPLRRILLCLGNPAAEGEGPYLLDAEVMSSLDVPLLIATPGAAARAADLAACSRPDVRALSLPGPATHAEIAASLVPALVAQLSAPRPEPLVLQSPMAPSQVA